MCLVKGRKLNENRRALSNGRPKTKKNQQERTNDDADKNLVGGILRLKDMGTCK